MTAPVPTRDSLALVLDREYGSDAALLDALLRVVRTAQAGAVRAAAASLCRGEDEFPVMHAARCAPLLAYADVLDSGERREAAA